MTETEAQQQIDIISGQREITLTDGRQITVKAYGFMDGFKVAQIAGPLLAGLAAFFARPDQDETSILSDLQAVFARDPDAMVQLLAYASDITESEIAELGDEDGLALLWTWWNLNSGFFVRRLVQDHLAQAAASSARDTAPHGFLHG